MEYTIKKGLENNAKLTQETLVLLTALDIIEEGTAVYRYIRMAARKNKVVDCVTFFDVKGFDVIELKTKKRKIELTLPVFFQNKLNLMPKKELAMFKTSNSETFKVLRKFYRDADDERPVDLIFDTRPISKRG